MLSTTFIYALCEPGTRTIRYIGKANFPQKRLGVHLRVSAKRQNHLGCWLQNVLERGERPALVILREVPVTMWQEEETRHIKTARALGMPLVNGTDGGDGLHNPSQETRTKIGAAGRGRIPSAETRAKRSAALKGQKRSAETRANIRESRMGSKNPMFGKKTWQCGRPLSAEQRAKVGAAVSLAWAQASHS